MTEQSINFLDLLNEEVESLNETLDDIEDTILDALIEDYSDDLEQMRVDLGLTEEEFQALSESIVKRVNSKGQVKRVKNRKIRTRRAALTTGLSKAQLKRRGRKAARARKRNPMGVKKGLRKRRRALRKRKAYGLQPNR